MRLIDYGDRFGEGDEIQVELFNESEAVIKWRSFSKRASYSGDFLIKIYYKINFLYPDSINSLDANSLNMQHNWVYLGILESDKKYLKLN